MAFFDNHRNFTYGTTQVAISLGSTNALLVEAIGLQNDMRIRQISGSTLSIMGVAGGGATLSAAEMVTLAAGAYPISGLSDNQIMLPGPGRFYLVASGNTAVVAALLIGKSQGT